MILIHALATVLQTDCSSWPKRTSRNAVRDAAVGSVIVCKGTEVVDVGAASRSGVEVRGGEEGGKEEEEVDEVVGRRGADLGAARWSGARPGQEVRERRKCWLAIVVLSGASGPRLTDLLVSTFNLLLLLMLMLLLSRKTSESNVFLSSLFW